MFIPLINLKRMHNDLKPKIDNCISKIVNSNKFINSKDTINFEKKFAKMNNSRFCLGVSNGTSALSLALESLEIGNGDHVITTTNTFFATYESIKHVGAVPILIDVNELNLTLDHTKLESLITNKTKAIIPVHIYGMPCNMKEINKIAKKNNLKVIEDCAQSHFSKIDHNFVGNYSDVAAFSFYPGKNIGAFGDAGCIVTNNKKIYDKIFKLRDHGRSSKYIHKFVGYNHRISSINSSIINIKLDKIFEWNKKRLKLAKIYHTELSNLKSIKTFNFFIEKYHSTFHLYVISVPKNKRAKLIKFLKLNGIETGIHYPVPLHLQPAVKENFNEHDFPVMNDFKDKILSLPICPYTKEKEVMYTIKKIKNFFI